MQNRITVLLCSVIVCCFCSKATQESSLSSDSVNRVSDTIRVAFYNVENLFDAVSNGDEYQDYDPAVTSWNNELYEKKIKNTADVLSAINAEIIGLCEIENENVLRKLQKELIHRGYVYRYYIIGDFPIKTTTCTALLSKLPVKQKSSIEIRLEDGQAVRNIIEADIEFSENTIKVFVAHWPSQNHSEQNRIFAAQALMKRLRELPGKTEYILLGDFNSNYNEYEKNSSQVTGINDHLKTIYRDVSGEVRFINETTVGKDPLNHYMLWLEVPKRERMSEVYNGFNQTLDHIILPASLYDSTGISYVDNSFDVFTWDGKLLKGNAPYRWQYEKSGTVKKYTGKGYSDHLPVVASFKVGAFSFDTSGRSKRSEHNEYDTVGISWALCNDNFSLEVDTSGLGSQSSFRITGTSQQKNLTVARKTVIAESSVVAFKIRGTGKISFRLRGHGGEWIYFNAPDFKSDRQARYTEQTFSKWTAVRLNLKHSKTTDISYEMEIRAGKDVPFDFSVSGI